MSNWRSQAECAGADPDWFFPTSKRGGVEVVDDDAKARAKETIELFCRRCPVVLECAQEARKTHARDGIWGSVLMYPKQGGTSKDQLSATARDRLNKVLAR